jgi:hypothetical protein
MTACHDSGVEESEEESYGTSDHAEGDRDGWPLTRVLDVVAVVLVLIVTGWGGGCLSLGVPSPSVPSVPSGSGVFGDLNLFSVPTYVRLQYGTQWADIDSGLLLLASVTLLVQPRWIWSIDAEDGGLSARSLLVVATGVMAVFAAVAGLVGWSPSCRTCLAKWTSLKR